MKLHRKLLAVAATVAWVALSLAQKPGHPAELMVGDNAPKLEVAKWVKGGAVDSLQKGRIYVVEFWATWCGPCKASIPHLTELQKKFGDKATFIGVSSFENDWSGVEPFVAKEGDQMDYHVAMDKIDRPTDRDGFMAKNWMEAAHQPGIPTAFVIGKDGKIAWIGHPMAMEEPLSQIIDGTFDEAAFSATYAAQIQKMVDEDNSPANKLMTEFSREARAKQWKEALATLDKLATMPGREMQVNILRLEVYGASGDAAGYSALGKKLMAGAAKNDGVLLNSIAWGIVDPKSKLSPRDLDLAKAAAERSVELAQRKDPASLDTLAWTYHWIGDNDKAAELESEALSKADPSDKANYEDTLKTFKG